MYAAVDSPGLLVKLHLSPGQAAEEASVPELIAALGPARDTVADPGHDTRAILDLITEYGLRPHIPAQGDRQIQGSVDLEI